MYTNWIGHILHRNCPPKHVAHEKIEGRIDVTREQYRRRKQPLDDLKETRGPDREREKWERGGVVRGNSNTQVLGGGGDIALLR
jgi:hypothetical protein